MVILGLDLAVIAIVVFCGWRGYRNGLIRGVFGVVSLVVSLFLASVAASAYSSEFEEMINPFVGGIIDSALVDYMAEETGPESVVFEDESENYNAAYSTLRRIGLPEAPSIRIAELTTEGNEAIGIPIGFLSDLIAGKLSSVIAFVAVFGIAFLLLAIIFAVIGNLVGFVFSLPGLKIIDVTAGVVFGLIKGLIIVLALAAVIRYIGLLAPDTLDGTSLLKYIVNNNFIADRIGI